MSEKSLEEKLGATKTDGEFCDILNKANGVKVAHYKLKKTEWEACMYQEYRILNGSQNIGWLLLWKDRLPFVHITAKAHKIDKYLLAKLVKEIEPDSWGEYFLINELVRFEDLVDKEYMAKLEKAFDEEGLRIERT